MEKFGNYILNSHVADFTAWKSALRQAWETGDYTGIPPYGDTAAYLQQVRNTFGPSWLTRFVLCNGAYAVVSTVERAKEYEKEVARVNS